MSSQHTHTENNLEGKLPISEKVAYGLGDTASCLYYSTLAQFLLFFYTDVFGITATAAGLMMLITKLWDTANDPIMGMIADRTTSRHGKFRFWILWMIPAFMLTGILVFTTPDLSMTGKLIWAYVTYSLVGMAYTAINVPYSALMGVMTSNSKERSILASFRFLGANSGSLIVNGTLLWLVATLGQGNEQRGFFYTMCLYAVIAGALFFITFKYTRERVLPPLKKNTVLRDLKDLTKNGPWLVFCVVGVLTLIYISVRGGATLYYFKYYIGNQSLASSYLVVGSVFAIAGVSCTKYILAWFRDKRRAYICLTLMTAAILMAFYFVSPTDIALLFGLQVVGAFLAAPLMPLTWAMFADTADYAEYKLGRRATGLIFSAGTTSQKLGWTLGGSSAGFMLGFYGFEANMEQAPDTLNGIVLLMSIIPASIAFLTAFVTLFYKIDYKMEKELEETISRNSAERAEKKPCIVK